jgi:hypothetical protein
VNLPLPTIQADNSMRAVQRPRFDLSARPDPAFSILRRQESSAHSNYDAFIIGLERRFSRLQFRTSYTLSYNKDDDSNERNYLGSITRTHMISVPSTAGVEMTSAIAGF